MSRICTGCGLTTDSSGNLIVDTNNSVWPTTTTCTDTGGTPIYCGTDGALRGPAEKFSKFDRKGKNYITDSPVRMTTFVNQDSVLYNIASSGPSPISKFPGNAADVTPLVMTIVNPSACLPFNVYLDAGVSHAKFDYTGPGNFQAEVSVFVTVTGATESFAGQTGHQIWAFDTGALTTGAASAITFDTMGAFANVDPPSAATRFVIAPGGTMTVTAYPFLSLDVNGSSPTCDIQNYTIALKYAGSND